MNSLISFPIVVKNLLIPEDGTDRLSRNVGRELPLHCCAVLVYWAAEAWDLPRSPNAYYVTSLMKGLKKTLADWTKVLTTLN